MNKEKVIIFGASTLGKEAYERLKSEFKITYFCDNDSKKWNTHFCDIKVISLDELLQNKEYKVVIASMYYGKIYEQLLDLGFSNIRIFKYEAANKQQYTLERTPEKYLECIIEAINNIDTIEIGIENNDPYVVLKDGTKLFGLDSKYTNLYEYKRVFSQLRRAMSSATFDILRSAITSYYYPHSMPGEVMPFMQEERKLFGIRQADTIEDMNLPEQRKMLLREIFSLKKGETFVEVGAYIGYSTLRHAKVLGENSKIVAIEADANNFSVLEKNIKANGFDNIIMIHKAIGAYEGKEVFYSKGRMQNSMVSTIIGECDKGKEVLIDTIDNILKNLKISEVNHISITVNGYEPEVIDGMINTIRNSDNIRITAAGWYERDGQKVCNIVKQKLLSLGLQVEIGNYGRVLAWKNK